ncbi:MAG TPA: hypothetical protein DCS63_04195 [Elusimicrobia bacterium]|nr:hypothetical protein [Elusimicrobiota bacterium]
MKKISIVPVLILAVGFAACKKRAPETIPRPIAAAAAAVVSTGPVKAGGLPEVPGGYLKNSLGQADKAGESFKEIARQGMDALNLDKTGGD